MIEASRVDVPLEVRGLENFIERNYRDGGRFQWARETLKNAEEAGAHRLLFGVDWQGVERHGVYRQMIADDGPGMDEAEMVAFFQTYGNSGKSVGGLHENFGIGAKSSLLPWNQHGLIIVSYHEAYDGPLVMWLRRDAAKGEYGVRRWDTEAGEGALVVAAHEVDLGDGRRLDLADVAPDFVREAGHGTVLLLLGNAVDQDTVLGDPTPPRDEHLTLGGRPAAPGRALRVYLDRRLWDVASHMNVDVTEFAVADRRRWPSTPARGSGHGQWNRPVVGASHLINYVPAKALPSGRMADAGTAVMDDGTEIDWCLWDGERSGMGRDFESGFIAARYSQVKGRIDELFDLALDGRHQAARYRQFGISNSNVAKRVWLIARPPLGGIGGRFGVYMTSDRNELRIQGGLNASDPLPWSAWAEQFANDMPKPIRDALAAARADDPSDPTDDSWRERLAERFSKRYRTMRLRSAEAGADRHREDGRGSVPHQGSVAPLPRRKKSTSPSGTTGRGGSPSSGPKDPDGRAASPKPAAVGLPMAEWVKLDAIEDTFDPGMLAVWVPPNSVNPDGLVQLNPAHPVIAEELEHWKLQYPPHLESEVEEVVLTVYKELAITSAAHSFALKPFLNTREDHDRLIDSPALTMALLGLMGADSVIGPRLGRLGVKKLPEARAVS